MDDLDAVMRRVGLVSRGDLVRGEQPCIDEGVEDVSAEPCPGRRSGACPRPGGRKTLPYITQGGATEHRQEFLAIPRRPRPLRGHQIANQLTDDRDAVLTDLLERRLGVLRQGPADAADVLVGLTSQEALLAVAVVPRRAAAKASMGRAPRSAPTSPTISSTNESSSNR